MRKSAEDSITIVGAGLVGSLLSALLARRGYSVTLLERRPDMRRETMSAGRSINLALSTRGIHALRELGLESEILHHAIPMRGRMIHASSGALVFQPYGKDDSEYINSISRAELNKTLMTAAEKTGRVRIEFGARVVARDFKRRTLKLDSGEERPAPIV
ncbi:MAG: FAD-dependent oxidoreductase, partial [Bdellovibrionota bacterium]